MEKGQKKLLKPRRRPQARVPKNVKRQEIKATLFRICKLLRDVEGNAYRTHSLAWDTYDALVDTNPVFAELFRTRRGVLTEKMTHEHGQMIQKLDEVLQSLRPGTSLKQVNGYTV